MGLFKKEVGPVQGGALYYTLRKSQAHAPKEATGESSAGDVELWRSGETMDNVGRGLSTILI